MPHLLIEYSDNVAGDIDVGELVRTAHAAAVGAGPFPLGGIRTRAAARSEYAVADQHPDNRFVHLTLTIGAGRDLDTKRRSGDAIFAAVAEYLAPLFAEHAVALSLYIFEADPDLSWKQSTMHDAVAARTAEGDPK